MFSLVSKSDRIAIAALAVSVFILPGASSSQAKDAKAAAAPAAAAVTVIPAQRREVVETATVTGTLVPRLEVLVSPEIEGLRIVELLADEGDRVKKGQVLVRLSRETLDAQIAQSDAALARSEASIAQAQAQISQSQANVSYTTLDLERARTLLGRGSSTQAIVDQKTSAARVAQAQLQAAKDALAAAQADRKSLEAQRRELMVRVSRAEVRTPEGGIISRRTAKLGATASAAAEPLFRIIANGEIELDAEIPEQQMYDVKAGQTASVVLADGSKIPGKLRLLSPEVDRSTRLGRVRIALEDSSRARIGAFARAVIEIRRSQAITVPSSAVIYDDGKASVQTVAAGVVKTKQVTLGLIANGNAEVVKGLNEGEDVIVRAGPFLRDGDAVTPVKAEGTR